MSHNFNYFADLLRIQSKVPGTVLRTDAFIHWFKEQLRKNRPFDDLVEEMVIAEGRMWENPAVGYHLRDNGMKLMCLFHDRYSSEQTFPVLNAMTIIPRLDSVRVL